MSHWRLPRWNFVRFELKLKIKNFSCKFSQRRVKTCQFLNSIVPLCILWATPNIFTLIKKHKQQKKLSVQLGTLINEKNEIKINTETTQYKLTLYSIIHINIFLWLYVLLCQQFNSLFFCLFKFINGTSENDW